MRSRQQADTSPVTTVVGIAEDVRRGSLSEPEAHYYLPIDQFSSLRLVGCSSARVAPASDNAEAVRRALQTDDARRRRT